MSSANTIKTYSLEEREKLEDTAIALTGGKNLQAKCVCLVFLYTGCGFDELTQLKVGQISFDEGEIDFGTFNSKPRKVSIPEQVIKALTEFGIKNKKDSERLWKWTSNSQSFRRSLNDLARKAGIPSDKVHTRIKNSFVKYAQKDGMGLPEIAHLMGIESLEGIKKYRGGDSSKKGKKSYKELEQEMLKLAENVKSLEDQRHEDLAQIRITNELYLEQGELIREIKSAITYSHTDRTNAIKNERDKADKELEYLKEIFKEEEKKKQFSNALVELKKVVERRDKEKKEFLFQKIETLERTLKHVEKERNDARWDYAYFTGHGGFFGKEIPRTFLQIEEKLDAKDEEIKNLKKTIMEKDDLIKILEEKKSKREDNF